MFITQYIYYQFKLLSCIQYWREFRYTSNIDCYHAGVNTEQVSSFIIAFLAVARQARQIKKLPSPNIFTVSFLFCFFEKLFEKNLRKVALLWRNKATHFRNIILYLKYTQLLIQ